MGDVQRLIAELQRLLDLQVSTGTITLTLNQRELVSVKEERYQRFVKRGAAPVSDR